MPLIQQKQTELLARMLESSRRSPSQQGQSRDWLTAEATLTQREFLERWKVRTTRYRTAKRIIGRRRFLSKEFEDLAKVWRKETKLLSFAEDKTSHWAYQKIMTMGYWAVPLILSEMEQRPGHWFFALQSITDEDPVKSEHAGNIALMTQDWLDFGKEEGYL